MPSPFRVVKSGSHCIQKYVSIRNPTVSFHPYSVISALQCHFNDNSCQIDTTHFNARLDSFQPSIDDPQCRAKLRLFLVTVSVASSSQSRHFHVTITSLPCFNQRRFFVTIASLPCYNQRRFFVTTVCRLLPPTLTITSTNTRQLLLPTIGFILTELNFLRQFYSLLRAFSRVEQQLTSFPYGSHLVDCFCAECHLSHG